MSDMPPPPQTGPEPARNLRAEAKAAKAYAKAERPWYKKKRWWLAAAVVVIIIAAVAGGGNSDDPPSVATDPNDSQSQEASSESGEPEPEPEPESEPALTAGQENAARAAEGYLDFAAFSRSGLIEQLEFEGYSTKDATYGAGSLNANWKEQAAKAAKNYLDMSAFSRSGLIEQLEFEGYTRAQAVYGVNQAGL